MNNNLPVLIVGAGPTGLMMASILARYGITFRIIDKNPERVLGSNATWIQTRTLELFNQMGILEKFLREGHRCDAINFYEDGKHLSQLSLKYVDSIYPFILTLPQTKTEEILENYLRELDCYIERAVELVDIKYTADTVTSTIKNKNDQIELITSHWLIACDGANSLVRKKCQFHFLGEDLTAQCMVADATINFSFMPKDEMHFFFDQGTVLAAFPFGANRYRLAANLHLDVPRKIFTEIEVIEMVQERAHGNYYVTDVSWISPFWIHGRVSDSLRKGPVILAGDAAHVYSPAGGQGMNTSIQDACNLAWKLALVIKKQAKISLLDSYQQERYPIIQETVNQNEFYTKLALFNHNFITELKKFSNELAGNPLVQQKYGNQLTQLTIQYEDSSIIDYRHKGPISSGQRAPNVKLQKKTLYDFFNNTQHNILIFTGENLAEETRKNIEAITKSLETKFNNLLKVYIVQKEELPGTNIIADSDWLIHHSYQIKVPTIVIVRPDTYIALISENLDIQLIENFLESYLL